MTANGNGNDLPALDPVRVQAFFVPQIEQSLASMHHIDELLQWLANAFVRYFNIRLHIIWANRVDGYGQLIAQLRTIARQDASFPEQIVDNDQMQHLAQQFIARRLDCKPQPLETLFSQYQTFLLKRYGLNYWGASFVSKNVLLPARENILMSGGEPAFLAMTMLFFLKQMPQVNIVQPMSFIVDKAMDAALARGLVLSPLEPQTPFPPSSSMTPFPFLLKSEPQQEQALPFQKRPLSPQERLFPVQERPSPLQEKGQPVQENHFTLAQLIPDQRQDANLMLSDNPFTQAAVISDKKARRLHMAIDGRATVAELCSLVGLSMAEVRSALLLLWEKQRVEIRAPDGQLVDLLSYLDKG